MPISDLLIAVVDDELPVRTALARILRLADYRVATYATGEAFLGSLDTRLPACAVVDVHMPGLSGLDIGARLLATVPRVPIVLITGSDDRALDRQAVAAGAVCLLRKPFPGDDLLAALHVAVGARSAAT